MTIAEKPPLTAESVRAALAAEWEKFRPGTSVREIQRFYRACPGELMANDLEVFHQLPDRQAWTQSLVNVAKKLDNPTVIDIGSGAGHDLRALRDAGIQNVTGVEPNDALRNQCIDDGLTMYPSVSLAPIEQATVLNCVDVLEHIPDPETWLGSILDRTQVGTLFLETSATWDAGTPLHLPANRGWYPGRCMQAHGYDKIGTNGRMNLWKRVQAEPIHSTAIVVTASQTLSIRTHMSMVSLIMANSPAYNWVPETARESGLLLARSLWASRWYRETCGDVFLMIDGDIGFQPQDAMHVVQIAREKRSIAGAAYPTKDGHHLAINPLTTEGQLAFGPGQPPLEVKRLAAGFTAVHRDVLDALIPTLPLCDANQPWGYWPIFHIDMLQDDDGIWQRLGEDFSFCERARNLGFKVWLDPSVELRHYNGDIPVCYTNMEMVRQIMGDGVPE